MKKAKRRLDDDFIIEEENEFEGIEGLKVDGNHIFFYCPVEKGSVLALNRHIIKLNKDLLAMASDFNISPPAIILHINSYGGSLMDSLCAIDYIQGSKVPVHTIIEGGAASAATLMSVVAKKRFITKNSFMLIHQLSAGAFGDFEYLDDEHQNNKMFMDLLKNIYTEHTKVPKLNSVLKREKWLDAKTCLKWKMVDKII